MPGPDADGGRTFAATFPDRMAAAMAEARGAMAGIASSGRQNGELIDPRTLARLHELYRLKVELEIETAGVLWRTAEVVCALTDVVEALRHRRRPAPPPPLRWMPGVRGGSVQARRSGASLEVGVQRSPHWPDPGAGVAHDGRENGVAPAEAPPPLASNGAWQHPAPSPGSPAESPLMPSGNGIEPAPREGWRGAFDRLHAA